MPSVPWEAPYERHFGGPGFHAPEVPDIDGYLKPEFAAKSTKAEARSRRHDSVGVRAESAREAKLSEPTPAEVSFAETEVSRPPRSGAPQGQLEQGQYAAREAAAQEQLDFRGGSTIVISASAVIVALLIALLIVLLLK